MADREIPNVPPGQDAQMRNYLSAVREAVNKLSAAVGSGLPSGGSASSITFDGITGLPDNINALIDTEIPPAPTGFAVQGMRVNSFLTWNASSFARLSFTEIYRNPALMDATLMTLGTSYTIAQYGTINWSDLGATSVAMASLVTGDKYVITAVGTSVNWAALGVIGDPVVGTVFTKLAITATGTGGAVLTATFTKNSTAITGAGFAQFLPDFTGAVLVGTSNGHIYVDSIDPGAVYAYWIKFISYAGIAGPYANSGIGVIGGTTPVGSSTSENIYGINAWLNSADILNGSITNAKIGNYIQSDNYNGTTLGWNLSKSGGNVNLNQLTVRDVSGNVIMGIGGAVWQYINGTGKPANNATVGATFGTNISGFFDWANVSTYIHNVAVQTAQIEDLAVNTLKIAGQAVTIPLSAYTQGSIALTPSTYTAIQSQAITSSGYPIAIFISATCVYSLPWALARDGVWIASGSSNNPSAVFQDTPGTGYHNYIFYVQGGTGTIYATNRCIVLLETKR